MEAEKENLKQEEENIEISSENVETSSVEETGKDVSINKNETENSSTSINDYLQGIDFSSKEKHEIIVILNSLLNKYDIIHINDTYLAGIKAYNRLVEKDEIASFNKFKEGNQNEEDFVFVDETLDQIKLIESIYYQKLKEQSSAIEEEKQKNLSLKLAIIEELKELINKQESLTETFNTFRRLQKSWKDVGMVPKNKLKELWNNYHHHVENFYDYVNLNKELKELDLKKNLEEKTKLCEAAENLLVMEDIKEASSLLQTYHEKWREIGPVDKDIKEDLWQRFKTATEKVNKRNHEYYISLKEEQKKNLEEKEKICIKAEEIANLEHTNHKHWNKSTENILKLQKEWKTVGAAPKKYRERIYKRFRKACDLYFEKKQKFYFDIKMSQEDNYKKKVELCERAEELQNNSDWKSTTDKLINLQRQWKEVGPVARKQSEKIWLRFRAACDTFFNARDNRQSEEEAQFEKNLEKKLSLIEELKSFSPSEDTNDTINRLTEIQNKWMEIGYVPRKNKTEVNETFNNILNIEFDKLELDSVQLNVERFKAKLNSYLHTDKVEDKIYTEREKLINKIKSIEQERLTLENNIGFLNTSKNNSLLDSIHEKIKISEDKLILLKAKLKEVNKLIKSL
ncbi:MAG: DUF349 domain-containing protein [Marinifilaceae bacterium]|jgi:hypothetical protein|nr:DUF349 domain-containing protein [Marinifilaceae bacterium]